jgi:two-component system, LytTR family, response regulator
MGDTHHTRRSSAMPHDATVTILEHAETLALPAGPVPALANVLVGEREHRLYILNTESIEYIESDGNYVKLHVANAEYISRDSVKRLANVLVGSGFIRIERSLLVNVRAILYAQRVGRGTFLFMLKSGSRLRSGARYRDRILQVLPLGHVSRPRSC